MVGQFHHQHPDAFYAGLAVHQYAPHVRMLVDLHAWLVGILPIAEVRTLFALARVLERIEVRRRGHGESLKTDGDPRAIHHPKHLAHPDVLHAAHELAHARCVVSEIQHAGGRAIDPHLVLDRRDLDIVQLSGDTVRTDPTLGYDEQRKSLGARRGAHDARKHHVNDVFRRY